MALLLPALAAVVLALAYCLTQARRRDETWEARRQRLRARRRPPGRPPDPNFRFDEPGPATEPPGSGGRDER
jgi:hypothetical protein